MVDTRERSPFDLQKLSIKEDFIDTRVITPILSQYNSSDEDNENDFLDKTYNEIKIRKKNESTKIPKMLNSSYGRNAQKHTQANTTTNELNNTKLT